MRITDYIRIVRQRLALAVVVIISVALASLGFSLTRKPVYEATTRLRVRPVAPLSDIEKTIGEAVQSGGLATEAELVKSTAVAERVLKRVPLPVSPDTMLRLVSTTGVPSTEILIISATTGNPQLSQNLANAFAEEYVAIRRAQATQLAAARTQRLSERIKEFETRIDQLSRQLRGLTPGDPAATPLLAERDRKLAEVETFRTQIDAFSDVKSIETGVGEIVQPASTATPKGASSPPKNLLLGVLVGIPMALGVVLLLDSISDTVRTKEDAERQTEAHVLGLVPFDGAWDDPDDARLASKLEPFSPVAEAHRALRLNVEHAAAIAGARRIMITSAGAGEGKSVTAANLALAFADAKRPVVLVDADLRRPRAHLFFDVEATPGLIDVLDDDVPIPRALQHPHADLSFLPSGTANTRPDLVFLHADVEGLFEDIDEAALSSGAGSTSRRRPVNPRRNGSPNGRAANAAPWVVVDAPPILQASEVSAIASVVDGVILVLQAGVTSRLAASRAAEQVRRTGGRVLGVVLVGVRSVVEPGFEASYETYRPRSSSAESSSRQEV